MRERFVPVLDKLPDSCDWDLHILTITQPVLEGDTNRSTLSDKSKKLVAAALCREAAKLGATGGPELRMPRWSTNWCVAGVHHWFSCADLFFNKASGKCAS